VYSENRQSSLMLSLNATDVQELPIIIIPWYSNKE
jgi:hypothetical protein